MVSLLPESSYLAGLDADMAVSLADTDIHTHTFTRVIYFCTFRTSPEQALNSQCNYPRLAHNVQHQNYHRPFAHYGNDRCLWNARVPLLKYLRKLYSIGYIDLNDGVFLFQRVWSSSIDCFHNKTLLIGGMDLSTLLLFKCHDNCVVTRP